MNTVVVLYHRIADEERDPEQLCVSPEHFGEHLDLFGRLADVVPLAQVTRPSARARVAITFDDGYADNLQSAKPALAARGCAATFFVSSGYLGGERRFWWDRLSSVFDADARSTHVALDIDGRPFTADVRSTAARQRLYTALHVRLRRLAVERIESVLESLEQQLVPRALPPGRPLTHEEVRELGAGDLASIGAHTRSHSQLSVLRTRAQLEEIKGSRQDLESVLGTPVRTFAYPFGDPESFTYASELCVRRAGFDLACWNSPGPVVAGRPLRVRRHLVRNWTPAELEQNVRVWLES